MINDGDKKISPGVGGTFDAELQNAIIESVLRGIAREIVLRGEVDMEALTVDELRSLASSRLVETVEAGDFEFAWVVDHSESILADARAFAEKGRDEYAFVYYGLYIEHTLNRAIHDRAFQLELSENEAVEIMRKSIPDKTGITWTLLFGSGLPDSIRADIRGVTERRNSFMHYKWQSDPTVHMLPTEIKQKRERAFEIAERASTELTRFVNRLVAPEHSEIDQWLHGSESAGEAE